MQAIEVLTRWKGIRSWAMAIHTRNCGNRGTTQELLPSPFTFFIRFRFSDWQWLAWAPCFDSAQLSQSRRRICNA